MFSLISECSPEPFYTEQNHGSRCEQLLMKIRHFMREKQLIAFSEMVPK
jgi:hypothetical protein